MKKPTLKEAVRLLKRWDTNNRWYPNSDCDCGSCTVVMDTRAFLRRVRAMREAGKCYLCGRKK